MSSVRLADYIFDFVAKQGVRHVFLVAGGGSMFLVDGVAQNSALDFVPTHHEQAAVIAAETYARVNENLGVAVVTCGPGATNAVTGVAGAWLESSPLLVLSGQVKRADLKGTSGLRQRGPQEVDIVSMVKPITKYAATVMAPSDIRHHLEKAVHLARSGRGGPVWLDVPLDVQAATIDPASLIGYVPEKVTDSPNLDAQALDVIELINGAERPLLLGGFGVRLAGASKVFRVLYELLNFPVATTWPAISLIPASHPLSIGRPGAVAQRAPNFAVQNSDLIISIGARLDTSLTAFDPAKFGRHARRVIVDVDRAELAKFDMPVDRAIVADARAFIDALLRQAKALRSKCRSEWLERCTLWKRAYPVGENRPLPKQGKISHYDFVRALSEALPENALIVTCSSGLAVEFFYAGFQNKSGQRIFNSSGLGAMGFGLPAIVGTSMAAPGERIVAVEGDGGMMFNLQELLTIRALNIPVCLFIMNNAGYASIRNTQRNYFGGRYVGTGPESKLQLPDFVELARSIGFPATRISDVSELDDKLRHALAQPGPFICDVELLHDEPLWPKTSTVPLPDGSLISMPLEDMWPLLSREELRANMLTALDPASNALS